MARHGLLLGLLLAAASPVGAVAPHVGGYAPEIDQTDLEGTPRKLLWGERGSLATVVFFFDPQSPDCLLEMSLLDALYRVGKDVGLSVFAVEARGRQPGEVRRLLERYCTVYRDPAFPVLPDPAFRVGRTYGVGSVPATFVMESHGVVLNRIEGYDHDAAVAIARRLEQLLHRNRGFFSSILRDAGITQDEEREAESRIAARTAAGTDSTARVLGVGDRVPELRFADLAGHTGRWWWGEGTKASVRLVTFLSGFSLKSIEALTWLDALMRRGRDAGLEALAVEAGGMDAAALGAALDRFRRYNPNPSFPVVADPEGELARVFGPLEQLPQTFLIGADGQILYRADGFSAGEGEIMIGKVERAFAVAGRPFPPPRDDSALAGGAENGSTSADGEAPSIRKKRDQDERYRSSIVQGDSLFMAWEFERALPYYQSALAIVPEDVHALVRTAQIFERLGERARAAEYWEKVLAVRPDHAEARTRAYELRPQP